MYPFQGNILSLTDCFVILFFVSLEVTDDESCLNHEHLSSFLSHWSWSWWWLLSEKRVLMLSAGAHWSEDTAADTLGLGLSEESCCCVVPPAVLTMQHTPFIIQHSRTVILTSLYTFHHIQHVAHNHNYSNSSTLTLQNSFLGWFIFAARPPPAALKRMAAACDGSCWNR